MAGPAPPLLRRSSPTSSSCTPTLPTSRRCPGRYAELLGGATRVAWPQEPGCSTSIRGFYVVCYLRAWALETHWRRALRERFGERWYAEPEAGEWLLRAVATRPAAAAEELLGEALGERLDFGALVAELTAGG